jgi:hypothetical protein
MTTNIFGRGSAFYALAKQYGAKIHHFSGGYDDYYGDLAWATIPVALSNPKVRFCPDPGHWLDGVRIYDDTEIVVVEGGEA